ncbi:hypothetical protein B6K86_05505 [Lachnospiraceae bacterium]|nr:hypothetical protein B6K86_05505 [Lachnospiraceae bacterium]
MLSEPMTLYKLMILYLLGQVNYPLTEDRISDFFLSREYTTYFTLKQALSELLESKLIHIHQVRNSTRYDISPEGEQTFQFFGKKISPEILADMDNFLRENRIRIRNEVGVTADYWKNGNQDYRIRCEINEGRSSLLTLEFSSPDEHQAELMRNRWKECSQDIYVYILKKLLGGN